MLLVSQLCRFFHSSLLTPMFLVFSDFYKQVLRESAQWCGGNEQSDERHSTIIFSGSFEWKSLRICGTRKRKYMESERHDEQESLIHRQQRKLEWWFGL